MGVFSFMTAYVPGANPLASAPNPFVPSFDPPPGIGDLLPYDPAPRPDQTAAPGAIAQSSTCTCPPNDRPPGPCPGKHALVECFAEAQYQELKKPGRHYVNYLDRKRQLQNELLERNALASGPYHGGYPFMDLARRHGVDYGDVLCAADQVELNSPRFKNVTAPALHRLSYDACGEIEAILRQPVWARGQ